MFADCGRFFSYFWAGSAAETWQLANKSVFLEACLTDDKTTRLCEYIRFGILIFCAF